MFEILSFVLSAVSMLLFMISNFLKGKKMGAILVLNVVGNLMMAAGYVCVSNASGAAISAIAAVVGIINYFYAAKQKKIPVWLLIVYSVVFICANLATFSNWKDIISLIAALTAVFVISSPNGKQYRIWAITNQSLWCLFDVLCGNWGPLASHLALACTTFLGILKNDIRKAPVHE